jgi:hypothetical protein
MLRSFYYRDAMGVTRDHPPHRLMACAVPFQADASIAMAAAADSGSMRMYSSPEQRGIDGVRYRN